MKEQLAKYLQRYIKVNEEEINEFYELLTKREYHKGDYLLKTGQVCHHKFFLISGLVRQFYVDEKGNDIITQFAIENWWLTNTESFVNQSPSKLNIQALEHTVALSISKAALEDIYLRNPKFERLFRMITEKTLIAFQRKAEFYMHQSSEERYQQVVDKIPNLIQRVPQYMIASYLRISPEYLSALRKKQD